MNLQEVRCNMWNELKWHRKGPVSGSCENDHVPLFQADEDM